MAAAEATSQDVSRWLVIYPAYINKGLSIQEGRKIKKDEAVENPTIQEIYSVLLAMKVAATPEPRKHYPRSTWFDMTGQGRVRVKITDDNGAFIRPEVTNRRQLYVAVAKLIDRLDNRSKIKDPLDALKKQTVEKKPTVKPAAKQTSKAAPKAAQKKATKKKK